jgi:lysophospholipase L1-like esterase
VPSDPESPHAPFPARYRPYPVAGRLFGRKDCGFRAFRVPNDGGFGRACSANAPVILAFGDSLYAGYQLRQDESYPAKLQVALNAAGTPVAVGAGVSGDTTAAGLQRLAFTLDNQPVKPALVLVGLGGNDAARAAGRNPLQSRCDPGRMKKRGLPAMLTGMLAAPNMGADYTRVQSDLAGAGEEVRRAAGAVLPATRDRQQSIVIGR